MIFQVIPDIEPFTEIARMNYITGSFSPAVSKSTVKMPVDQSGAPLVVDEDQIKVSDIPRSSVVTHLKF